MSPKQTNVKDELKLFLSGHDTRLICAEVVIASNSMVVSLHEGYGPKAFEAFLAQLDFNYEDWSDSDDYPMSLFRSVTGTFWFEDGNWAARSAIDGREWWGLSAGDAPPIPDRLSCR
jgi:hypothetical protein